MAVPEAATDVRTWSEVVVAIGAAIMAVAYGITRVYKMAKNVDDLVELVKENGVFAKKAKDALDGVVEDMKHVKEHVSQLQSWQDKEDGRHEAERILRNQKAE